MLLSFEQFLHLQLKENLLQETNITDFGQDHINGIAGSYDAELRNKDNYLLSNEYTVFLRDFKNGKYLKTDKEWQERRKLRLRAKRRKK